MTLTIDDEMRGGIVILHLGGRLDTATSKALENHIAGQLAKERRRLVIDLANIDYISSYGLRVFLMTAKRLTGSGDGLVLCDVQPSVLKVLEISGFDRILELCGSIAEGLERIA